jgi:hypothetical protein
MHEETLEEALQHTKDATEPAEIPFAGRGKGKGMNNVIRKPDRSTSSNRICYISRGYGHTKFEGLQEFTRLRAASGSYSLSTPG